TMGPEQWLFLQWHEHKGSLVSTFEKLFERNTFVDCTLAAEGQYLNVHKMILSACSPYFEILLNENRDKHPIIILKDVKFRSLKSIIEYMYRGEANVLSTEMTDFLAAAETLQIKGIGKQGGGDTRTQPKNLRDLMEEQSRPPCPTMQIINEEKDNWADSDLSSALTETVQDSFVTQNAVLFSQGDAGPTIALPQKLPKAAAPAEAAAEEAEAAAPGLGSHTEA
ncbi:Longitudinals lacking protein, isoforms H/M/V, partial [Gryllus bimaculatus]